LAILPRLDGERKQIVMQFLYESGLIAKGSPVISPQGCDLRGVDFPEATLREADLCGALLEDANLQYADLRGVYLGGIQIETSGSLDKHERPAGRALGAPLTRVRMDLWVTTTRRWVMADLRRANLSDASGVTNERLEQQAESLEGATLPNGQKYEDWLKDKEGSSED
jgi:uncharacterized protein YjbI with pentapeptide repeats